MVNNGADWPNNGYQTLGEDDYIIKKRATGIGRSQNGDNRRLCYYADNAVDNGPLVSSSVITPPLSSGSVGLANTYFGQTLAFDISFSGSVAAGTDTWCNTLVIGQRREYRENNTTQYKDGIAWVFTTSENIFKAYTREQIEPDGSSYNLYLGIYAFWNIQDKLFTNDLSGAFTSGTECPQSPYPTAQTATQWRPIITTPTAMAMTNKYLIIGEKTDSYSDISNSGSVHIYQLSDGSWSEQAEIYMVAPTTGDASGQIDDYFGSSVAIMPSGDDVWGAIGAPNKIRWVDDVSYQSSGMVYPYKITY